MSSIPLRCTRIRFLNFCFCLYFEARSEFCYENEINHERMILFETEQPYDFLANDWLNRNRTLSRRLLLLYGSGCDASVGRIARNEFCWEHFASDKRPLTMYAESMDCCCGVVVPPPHGLQRNPCVWVCLFVHETCPLLTSAHTNDTCARCDRPAHTTENDKTDEDRNTRKNTQETCLNLTAATKYIRVRFRWIFFSNAWCEQTEITHCAHSGYMYGAVGTEREGAWVAQRGKGKISRFKRNWCGQLVLSEYLFLFFSVLFCSLTLPPSLPLSSLVVLSLAICLFFPWRSAAAVAVLFVAEHLFTFERARYANREWVAAAATATMRHSAFANIHFCTIFFIGLRAVYGYFAFFHFTCSLVFSGLFRMRLSGGRIMIFIFDAMIFVWLALTCPIPSISFGPLCRAVHMLSRPQN